MIQVDIVLPGDAILRLQPAAFMVLGKFDVLGRFSLPLHGPTEKTMPAGFLMQVLSFELAPANNKLCTSQLVGVRVDSSGQPHFTYLG